MASSSNPFFGVEIGTLNALKTSVTNAISAVLLNQSYSLNGKSVTRANLPDLTQMLGQVQSAIDLYNNNTTNVSYVSFNGY
jgi:hypothetical protein